MRFWFVPSEEVPLREQIAAQMSLAIASGELAAGERLPSTRELARRYRLHPNTVSAAYRQLDREGRVELRRGSGVFVRGGGTGPGLGVNRVSGGNAERSLDRQIGELFQRAREFGVPSAVLRERLRQWLDAAPVDHFLVVEPDEELRAIVMKEVEELVNRPVAGVGLEAGLENDSLLWRGAMALVLPSKASAVRERLPAGIEMIALQVRSVPDSLAEWLPLPVSALAGVASRWSEFVRLAKTMLVAAGFDGDGLICRDARDPGWQRGLEDTDGVVCDIVTATQLRCGVRAVVFRILAESTTAELRALGVECQDLHGAP